MTSQCPVHHLKPKLKEERKLFDSLQKNIVSSNSLWLVILIIQSPCLPSDPLEYSLTICKPEHYFTYSCSCDYNDKKKMCMLNTSLRFKSVYQSTSRVLKTHPSLSSKKCLGVLLLWKCILGHHRVLVIARESSAYTVHSQEPET